ncbi:MAG: response regulator transcription factor [Oscillospiraceae bacterium]
MFEGRILLADDDRAMRALLYEILTGYGFLVFPATESGLRKEQLSASEADAAVLSVHSADCRAAELLSRGEKPGIPVIILLPQHAEEARPNFLDLGAADVFTKPFDCGILARRLKALMPDRVRELLAPLPPYAEYGGISVDIRSGKAFAGGNEIKLKPKELSLLRVFLVNHDVILRRYELAAAAWGGRAADEHSMNVHIYAIKRALGSQYGSMLKTLRGKGYMLTGKTEK